MADKEVENRKDKQGASWLKGCSPITGKGLAEKSSQALFVNLKDEKETGNLDIVMTGFAGLAGSAILADEKYEALSARYPAAFLEGAKRQKELAWQIPEAAPAGKSGGCCPYSFQTEGIWGMYLLSEGGVFAGLWNMGKMAGVGLKVYCKSIPVKQETIEICNFFDVNPYQMFSEGSCLLLAENGYRLRERLLEQRVFSEIIGFTTKDNDRVVINGEERRFLQKKYEDALISVLLQSDESEKK